MKNRNLAHSRNHFFSAISIALASAALFANHSAQAANITLTDNDGGGNSSFSGGLTYKWSDGLAPHADDYFTEAWLLRSPTATGAYTFGGSSLTLGGVAGTASGRFVIKNAPAGMTLSANYILKGGILALDADPESTTATVAGTINVLADSIIASSNRTVTDNELLIVTATMTGSAVLQVNASFPGATGSQLVGTVRLSGANPFSGTLRVMSPLSASASPVNGALQLNNLNAAQNATVTLNTSTVSGTAPAMSFLDTSNTGTYHIGALDTSSNTPGLILNDTAGAAVALSVGSKTGTTTFAGALSGLGSITKVGSGSTWILGGANTYTSTTIIKGGTLSINGSNGTINQSTGVTATGGTISLNNAATINSLAANVDRINDAAPVTLGGANGGGTFTLNSVATEGATETIGALTLDSGNSTVTLTGGTTGDEATATTTLAIAGALSRSNHGTALVRATNMGSANTTSTRGMIHIGTPLTSSALVGATAAAGVGTDKTLKIIPFLIGGTITTGTPNSIGTSLVTLDSTVGLRMIDVINEIAAATVGYTTPPIHQNVKIGSTGITLTNASGIAFNSLLIAPNTGGAPINSTNSNPLTIDSGALIYAPNAVLNGSIESGFSRLNLDNSEGVVNVVSNTLTINTPIDVTQGGVHVANGALTKAGAGTLVLGANNLYTGQTTVNQGTLVVSNNSAASFADASTVSIATGAVLNLPNAATDIVASLVLGGVAQANGVYDSSTPGGYITGAGKIEVGVSAGYTSWASTNAGGQAFNLDFDLDGVVNGIEYFMGEVGSTFTANPPVVLSGSIRTVTWPKDSGYSGSYKVETSPDLVIWTNVTATGAVVDNTTSVVYTLAEPSGKLFVRLAVTPN